MAAAIREGSHQLGACGKVGIPWRTHKRWLAADAEEGSDLAVYQSIILEALDEQRVESMRAGLELVEKAEGSKASSMLRVWEYGHNARFKRFQEDDAPPARHELTGAEGGPLAVTALPASREQALNALAEAARRDPEIATQLKKLTGGGE